MAANTIWVSSSARSGGNGSETSPYATIQAAVNAATPGTTIMVKAGIYNEHVKFNKGGTASAPVQLVSADGKGAAEIRPVSSTVETIRINAPANYITIDGFKVIGPSMKDTIHVTSIDNMTKIPSYITIKNNDIRPGEGDGVKISQGDHIYILNNTVTGSGQEQGIDGVGITHSVISGNDVSGIKTMAAIQVKGGSIDVEISYNKVHDTQKYGFLVGGSTNTQNLLPGTTNYEAKNIRMFGNEVDGSAAQALRVMGAHDVKISGNWFHDVGSSRFVDIVNSGTTHPDWPSNNVTFEGNSFDRASWLKVDSGQGTYTLLSNRTDGAAPVGWSDNGANIPDDPAPLPPPQPAPDPGPAPAPVPAPTKGAHDDFGKTTVGKVTQINLLGNDDPLNWTKFSIVAPKNGALSKATDSQSIKYTPKTGFVGTDTFKYTLTDNTGFVSTATVTVTVEKAATTTSSYDLFV